MTDCLTCAAFKMACTTVFALLPHPLRERVESRATEGGTREVEQQQRWGGVRNDVGRCTAECGSLFPSDKIGENDNQGTRKRERARLQLGSAASSLSWKTTRGRTPRTNHGGRSCRRSERGRRSDSDPTVGPQGENVAEAGAIADVAAGRVRGSDESNWIASEKLSTRCPTSHRETHVRNTRTPAKRGSEQHSMTAERTKLSNVYQASLQPTSLEKTKEMTRATQIDEQEQGRGVCR